MSDLVPPHGSDELKPLLASENEIKGLKEKASSLTKVPMSTKEVSDILMFAIGAYTPLEGFMGYDDWKGVCENMQLKNGVFWPIPITLSCDQAKADEINEGDEVALIEADSGEIYAIMKVEEKYKIDRNLESQTVYGTTDNEHPGVQKVMSQPEINLAGPVTVISEGDYPEKYKGLYFTPAETRKMFKDNGWSTVAAFQTRNPMHRSHEHLAKIAVEVCDGVFIHQVLGALKPGDIPAEVRVDAINTLVEHYFVDGTVITGGYPIEMRYAGPREALLHALLRQNFGCSHLIVGRDHAGVGDYYGPFDAQEIFDKIPNGSLHTMPLKIDITFYCFKCDGMATAKTCPHSNDDRLNISGTKLRGMFSEGKEIPIEFSRPEVVEVLQKYYDSIK